MGGLADFNMFVRPQRELAERKNRGPSIFRTKEQAANFQKSPFMQKVREHQMAVYHSQNRRDEERRRTDPEFNPRDDVRPPASSPRASRPSSPARDARARAAGL